MSDKTRVLELERELAAMSTERDAHLAARGQIDGLKTRIAEIACERDMIKSALHVATERANRAEERLAVMRTMAVLWERQP